MPTFATSDELYAVVIPFLEELMKLLSLLPVLTPAFAEYRAYLERSGHSALPLTSDGFPEVGSDARPGDLDCSVPG